MGFLSSLLNMAGDSVGGQIADITKYRLKCSGMNESELTDELVRVQQDRDVNKAGVIIKILREEYGYGDADLRKYRIY